MANYFDNMPAADKKALNISLGVPVNVKHYGAVGDGVTDDTAAIQFLIDTLSVAGGGVILHPGGRSVISSIVLKPLVKIVGVGGDSRTESALNLEPIQSTFVVKSGNSGIIVNENTGHSELQDIRIEGEEGAIIGLDIRSYNFNTKNVGVRGFSNGVGVKLKNSFRAHHFNLDIQGCGLGLWLDGVCNAICFSSIIIENCTCGIYTAECKAINFNNLTLESIGKGRLSTSFPDTNILTVNANYLNVSGIPSQVDFEGGAYISGTFVFNGGYFESIDTVLMHAFTNSVVNISGAYFNDNTSIRRPRNFIDARNARSILVKQSTIVSDNSRGNAIFVLNTDRHHEVLGTYISHIDGSVYTGTVYEDITNGTFIANKGFLANASGDLLSVFPGKILSRSQNVTSSSNVILINVSDNSVFYVDTLNENTTINTSNEKDGQYLEIHIFQDPTGGRTVLWNSKFRHSWSDTGNIGNKKTSIAFRYRASQSRWYQVGAQVAYHD